MKRLLIAYASQTGRTSQMASAAAQGAKELALDQLEVQHVPASEVTPARLLACDGFILASPENFGYMSGTMKDLLDRCYYPCVGHMDGIPYLLLISAGNDGSGAERSMQRILRGLAVREAHPALIHKGPLTGPALAACAEAGATLAAGLDLGIF